MSTLEVPNHISIRAFKGYRPSEYTQVTALPYDVVNSEEARVMAAGNPKSLFHLSKPEIDLPEGTKYNDPVVYEKAKENMKTFLAEKYIVPDEKPCLYIYSLTFRGRTQNGIQCLCSVAQYKQNLIMRHEEVREVRVADRSNLLMAQRANHGPVYLAYRNHPEIEEFIREFKETHEPVADFVKDVSAVCNEPVRHQFWQIIQDDEVEELRQLINMYVDKTYIADGHHRAASSIRVGEQLASPSDTGDESHWWFLAVLFPGNELSILDYNRVVKDLNGMDEKEFLDRVQTVCNLTKLGPKMPEQRPEKRTFYMYLPGCWYSLEPKQIPESAVSFIDSAVLTDVVIRPILGIADLKNDSRIDFVGGIRGYKSLMGPVDNKKAAVAFALHPTDVDDVMTVADKQLLMPPKSTWFEPKLLSGMVVRVYSEEKVPGGPVLDENGAVVGVASK